MEVSRTLRLVLVGIFLSSFLLLYECKRLDDYEFPVYRTEFCPENRTEWRKRSSAFNCTEDTLYSCFPNENLTMLLEFCYPAFNIPIEEGVCLFLKSRKSLKSNESKLDSYNCRHFEYGCPTSYYTGSTAYIYPSCSSIGIGCFLAESSCKSNTHPAKGKSEWIWILSLVIVIVLCSFIGSFIFIYHRRNKKGIRHQRDDERTNEEETESLMPNEKDEMTTEIRTRGNIYDEARNDNEKSLKSNEEDKTLSEKEADKDTFEQWENDDGAFVQTKATQEVERMIKSENHVIVTGFSGSGKSAIIQHIALYYRKKGWVVRPVDAIEEIKDAYFSNTFKENETLFVFNDPIGKEVFDDILYCSWKKYEERLKAFLKKVKLLMTCRKQILNDSRTKGIFSEKKNS
ncbi:uncharacterized protein LOC111135836 [Crassostrea virginica]